MLIALFFTIMGCAEKQDKIIAVEDLPVEIQQYVTNHFPNDKIKQAEEDNELISKTYELILDNNTQLAFDSKGKVTDIDSASKLPDSVIPEEILSYTKLNYPENVITDWEIDDRNQQIELNNGVGLIFNMDGEFVKIDID